MLELKSYRNIIDIKNLIINFGPQHPAAHGVLRLILELQGETIKGVIPIIGLLHRGTEKLIESKSILQVLPYFDRLDYVSTMAQELCYSEAIEKICFLDVPYKAKLIRVLFFELTRILNHILAVTTHALDVGALTPFLWGFEEREKIMEFYERVSGARLHAAFIRPGGVLSDLPEGLLFDLRKFLRGFISRLDEISNILTENRIWNERLRAVGLIDTKNSLNLGFSGVMLRATGFNWDLRRDIGNVIYEQLSYKVILGSKGDSFDRYLIRMEEMFESIWIIDQCIDLLVLNNGDFKVGNYKYNNPSRSLLKFSMEHLIHHFKYFTEGVSINKGYIYHGIEAPKGEFGVCLFVEDNFKLDRCKIRAPGFFHLAGLEYLSKELLLADLIVLIGSLDLVFGEIDR